VYPCPGDLAPAVVHSDAGPGSTPVAAGDVRASPWSGPDRPRLRRCPGRQRRPTRQGSGGAVCDQRRGRPVTGGGLWTVDRGHTLRPAGLEVLIWTGSEISAGGSGKRDSPTARRPCTLASQWTTATRRAPAVTQCIDNTAGTRKPPDTDGQDGSARRCATRTPRIGLTAKGENDARTHRRRVHDRRWNGRQP
jgi:hypothetical protein